MKIVLYSMNFAPEPTGIGKYSGEMVDEWVRRGHEVVVVCAPPYYPDWRRGAGYGAWSWRREGVSPSLTVLRCPVWLPRRLGGLARLLHLASFALSSLPVVLSLVTWRPAVVFTVAPAFFCAPAGWLTARLCGAAAWLHIQDFEVDAAFELGMLSGRRTRTLVQALERRLLQAHDVVSTLSRQMLRKLQAKGVPAARCELLPNWVDLGRIRPQPCTAAMRDALGLPHDAFVALFSGTINRKQAIDVVIEAARLLADRADIHVVICGNGELRPELERQAEGLDGVHFLDLRPAEQLGDLLATADVHLLPQRSSATDLVMPSKLGAMLASGRPVVATAAADSEIAAAIEGCGLRVEPESPAALAAALRALADDPVRGADLGAQARQRAAQLYGAAEIWGRLEARLGELAGDPPLPVGMKVPESDGLRR